MHLTPVCGLAIAFHRFLWHVKCGHKILPQSIWRRHSAQIQTGKPRPNKGCPNRSLCLASSRRRTVSDLSRKTGRHPAGVQVVGVSPWRVRPHPAGTSRTTARTREAGTARGREAGRPSLTQHRREVRNDATLFSTRLSRAGRVAPGDSPFPANTSVGWSRAASVFAEGFPGVSGHGPAMTFLPVNGQKRMVRRPSGG
jgi:hypothetical protein